MAELSSATRTALRDAYAKRHFLWLNIRAELKAACYAGSWLSSGWWLLEPLLLMFVYMFVIEVLRGGHSSNLGALFIFCGVLPYRWFVMSTGRAVTILIGSTRLIKQVPFTKVLLPSATVVANTFHFLFGCVILAVMLALYRVMPTVQFLWFPVIVGVQFLLTLGVAFFLSAATVTVRDVQGVVPFVLRTMLFVSPIFYDLHEVPLAYRGLIMLNPLCALIGSYKNVLLYGRPPHLVALLILACVSCLLVVAGFLIIVKNDKRFARWL